MTVVMFTKMLQRTGELSLPEAADVLVDLGFDGADLTVRPGGYVEPDDAATGIPEAIEIFAERGLTVPMLTTAITDADDPATREIFAAADAHGVEAIKLGYWPYDGFGSLRRQLDEMRVDLNGIYAVSRDYDVTPCLHIHSGRHLTAEATLLRDVLSGYHPDHLGAYLDPAHMTLEGGRSGWELGMDALQEYTSIVSVKNFGWVEGTADDGTVTWEYTKYPVADGLTPWDAVVENLDAMEFDGIYSVHSEYYDMSWQELQEQTAADVAYLQELLDR